MAKRSPVRWRWLAAAAFALAVTIGVLGWSSGSCADSAAHTCTTVSATSPPIFVLAIGGLVATAWFCLKAFRR